MKIFSHIKNSYKIIQRTVAVAAIAATAVIMVGLPAARVLADWGPARPTFDYNKFDSSKPCTDPANDNGRCGSMTGPVFDSFTNTPTYGDERNFTTASPAGTSQWQPSVVATPGQDVEVRVFIHNNANQNTNGANNDGPGVALNTNVRIAIPSGQANGIDVGGYISASNATPGLIYDTATIKNDNQAFSLQYVPGSAMIYNSGPFSGGQALPDSIVTSSGATVGYNALDGRFPGCFNFQAVVIIKLHVLAPTLQFSKKVTTPGSTNWQTTMSANKGDTVSWLLDYKNTGSDVANDITIRDSLPAGLTLVPGTITWFDSNHPSGEVLQDTALGSGGVDVGNYGVNGGGFIRFRAVIDPNYKQCTITNVAYVHAVNVPEMNSTATVTIPNCTPPTTPPAVTTSTTKPTQLVNTGPTDVFEIFTAVSSGAGASYHVFQRKRYNR